jgi:hypothetical protein
LTDTEYSSHVQFQVRLVIYGFPARSNMRHRVLRGQTNTSVCISSKYDFCDLFRKIVDYSLNSFCGYPVRRSSLSLRATAPAAKCQYLVFIPSMLGYLIFPPSSFCDNPFRGFCSASLQISAPTVKCQHLVFYARES